jgi:hypothetical protein
MFNFFRPYVPGFHFGPQDDVPGFNIDENGLPRRAIAWPDDGFAQWYPEVAQTPGSIDFQFSRPEATPIGLAAFRPQDRVPGFNVRPEDMSASNLNENDDQPEETIWSTEVQPPPPDIEEPVPPAPSPFPEWFYKLVPKEGWSPAVLDPLTGQRIAINSPPSLPPTELHVPEKWPYSNVFPKLSIPPSMRSPYLPPVGPSAVSRAWPQPQLGSWPYFQLSRLRNPSSNEIIQHPIGHSGLLEAKPIEGSNSNLGNTGSNDVQLPPQQTPWQQYQQRPSSSLGNAAPKSDGPSLGQRLAQSSVDTIVPGAYYQKLAREQLGAGNYLGAGVYQGAALLDAALGAATLGLSTRLAAGVRVAAGEGATLFRRAFNSGSELLRYLGRAPEGMQWHHIVEQSQAQQFGQRAIQSIENIVAIPIEAHQKLNAFYSSKRDFSKPKTVREWLRGQSFEVQYAFGMEQLKRVLGY